VEGVIKIFVKSLDNKKFAIENSKARIPLTRLEREPKEIGAEMAALLEKIRKK
jgi:hypothetical protein